MRTDITPQEAAALNQQSASCVAELEALLALLKDAEASLDPQHDMPLILEIRAALLKGAK